jgi:hypothetical protein
LVITATAIELKIIIPKNFIDKKYAIQIVAANTISINLSIRKAVAKTSPANAVLERERLQRYRREKKHIVRLSMKRINI